MDAHEQERARLARLYADILEHAQRGAAILPDPHPRFVKRPNPNDFTPEGMLRSFVQTHQREVVEYIVRQINAGNGVQDEPPPTEGLNDDLP